MQVAEYPGIDGNHAVRQRPLPPAPLALPAVAMAAGVWAGEQGVSLVSLLGGIGIVAAMLAFGMRGTGRIMPGESRMFLIGLATLAASAGYARYHAVTNLPVDHVARMASSDEPRLANIEGVIVTAPSVTPAERRNPFLPTRPAPVTRFVLDVRSAKQDDDAISASGFLAVSLHDVPAGWRLGDRVSVTGWLHAVRGPRNPGETDWRTWYARQRIYATISIEDAALIQLLEPRAAHALGLIADWRTIATGLLFEGFSPEDDESRRLLDALVLGQRSAVDRALNEAFLRTGAIHFLSVSGYHVGLLTFVSWWLLKRLRRGTRTTAGIALVLLISYTLIAEPNSPILRATVMGVSLCIAALLQRPVSGLNWLAFSAVVLLAYNPLELFQAGFQFSFLQVAALLTVIPAMYRRLASGADGDNADPASRDVDTWRALFIRRCRQFSLALALTCFCCWLIALPLTLYHFGLFGLWAPLQSVLITPLVSIVTVLGFVQLLVGQIPLLGELTTDLLLLFTRWLLAAVRWLGSWPLSLIEVTRPAVWAVIVAEVALFGLLRTVPARPPVAADGLDSERKASWLRRWGPHTVCLVLLVMVVLAWHWETGRQREAFDVCVLAVGNGSAVILRDPSGHGAVIDAGTLHNFDVGRTVSMAAAEMRLRRLEFLAVSHGNLDHYSGIPSVALRWRPVHAFCHPDLPELAAHSPLVRRLMEETGAAGVTWTNRSAGESIELGPAVIEVLWPPGRVPPAWEENDRSLTLRLTVFGVRVLFPGDAAAEAMNGMISAHDARRIDLRCDVLIAPHHGAIIPRLTEQFYRRVEPECVVVSTGRDRTELRRMVNSLFGGNCRVLSTEDCGAITIRIATNSDLYIDSPFSSGK